MKRLLQLLLLALLTIPTVSQKISYFPKRDSNWNVIRDIGFFTVTPDNVPVGQKLKLEIAIHGVGEWSAGTIENLKNLALGFDYDNNGTREGAAFVTPDMYKAVNLFGIVLVVPTYESGTFFEPAKINSLYDYAQANYSLYPKMFLTGFSYGGGAVVKYVTSSTANAGRVAYAVPCAPTRSFVDWTIPGKVGVPVHIFLNDKDSNGATDTAVAKGIIRDLNKNNPIIPAIYTAFRKDGHGGNIEAWALLAPKAPGGQGFIDAAENTYQVFDDATKTGVLRQMKSGSVIPIPDPTPTPTPAAKAIVKFTLTGSKLKLDGTGSTGWANGFDGIWGYDGGPVQYSWDVFLGGSNWIIADATLTKAGTYKFSFKLKGDPEIKTVSVNFGRVLVSFDSETDLITYSDGTTERGIAIFASGKWVIKNSAGQILE